MTIVKSWRWKRRRAIRGCFPVSRVLTYFHLFHMDPSSRPVYFVQGTEAHPALTLVHWTVLSANSFVQNQGFIIFEPDEIAHWTGFDVASMCTTLKTARRVPAVNDVDLVLCYLPLGNDAAKSKQQEWKFPSAFSNSGQVRPFKVMWL